MLIYDNNYHFNKLYFIFHLINTRLYLLLSSEIYLTFFQTLEEKKQHLFTVFVKGAPPLKVAWYRDGKKLRSSATSKITFVRGISKLQFLELSGEDTGEYKVEAVNAFGEASSSVTLTVQGTPIFIFHKNNMHV